jgi:hypothetical protein
VTGSKMVVRGTTLSPYIKSWKKQKVLKNSYAVENQLQQIQRLLEREGREKRRMVTDVYDSDCFGFEDSRREIKNKQTPAFPRSKGMNE